LGHKEARAVGKNMTLRMSDEQAADLEAVARAEGIPIAEVVRQAIIARIEARRKDKAFQARLRASLERDRLIMERLASR
jgi:antitoxin component of RelBE/YafQ-DinJ toxin-antitoxin module